MKSATTSKALRGVAAALFTCSLAACAGGDGGGSGTVVPPPSSAPDEIQSFASVQEVFDLSCSFSTCHSAVTRSGDLVLDHEEISLANLVDVPAFHPEAQALGLKRVVPGDPENSFLIRKLRGLGPGDAMPQDAAALSGRHDPDDRGMDRARRAAARRSECPAACRGNVDAATARVRFPRATYVWQPRAGARGAPAGRGHPALHARARRRTRHGMGDLLRLPRRRVDACPPTNIRAARVYRMHQGSHHLLALHVLRRSIPDSSRRLLPVLRRQLRRTRATARQDTGIRAAIRSAARRWRARATSSSYPQGVGLPFIGDDVGASSPTCTTRIRSCRRSASTARRGSTSYFYGPVRCKAMLDGDLRHQLPRSDRRAVRDQDDQPALASARLPERWQRSTRRSSSSSVTCTSAARSSRSTW